ncbi:MAG: SpaH/EbpB family LPXTG-anchored major pilin [Roseburia sp.]|nr:SpaH/EbpB family LPXTG-anchored major pilin [Roseburia sp.]MCM1097916.1 SpaH/EbpB family LPXTG-anchored major pilin [Ruminococcus flavefaciens]
MKKMKKFLAMFLAMAMVLGMSLTALADETADEPAKISIVNYPDGADDAEVKYDQIIVEDRTSALGWKFEDAFQDAFVKAYLQKETVAAGDVDKVIAALIENGRLEDVNGLVEEGEVNDSEPFARALDAIKNMLGKTPDNSSIPATAIGLYVINVQKTGYTFIPMAVYVGTEFTGVKASVKGSKDQVKKELVGTDGASVSEGDEVEYKVTAQYPYYSANETTTTFVITDTLTNAAFKMVDKVVTEEVEGETVTKTEKVADVTVKINGETVTTGYTLATSNNGSVLTITFDYNNDYAGDTVEITYTAIAGDVSSVAGMKNEVSSTLKSGSTTATVESDTVTFTVTKLGDAGAKLGGAGFTVYEKVAEATTADAPENTEKLALINNNNTDDEADDVYAWGKSLGERFTAETDVAATANTPAIAKGEVTFDGLDAQKTYYVKETTAPYGYSLNETVYQLTRDTTNDSIDTTSTPNVTVYHFTNFNGQDVTDTKLNALPSTGGIGTTIFTIGGCAIMVVAAGLFFATRKKSSEK